MASIPILGGSTASTCKELPPLCMSRDEWERIGKDMGWMTDAETDAMPDVNDRKTMALVEIYKTYNSFAGLMNEKEDRKIISFNEPEDTRLRKAGIRVWIASELVNYALTIDERDEFGLKYPVLRHTARGLKFYNDGDSRSKFNDEMDKLFQELLPALKKIGESFSGMTEPEYQYRLGKKGKD